MKKIKKLNCDQTFTPADKNFLDDVDNIIINEYGATVEVDKLLVVKNMDTNMVGLFMPTSDTPEPPEGYEVVGTVMPQEENVIDTDILQSDGTEGEGFLQEDQEPAMDVPTGMPEEPSASSKKPLDDFLGKSAKPTSPDEDFNPWEDA